MPVSDEEAGFGVGSDEIVTLNSYQLKADLAKLKKFVGRYRDVLQSEGGKVLLPLLHLRNQVVPVLEHSNGHSHSYSHDKH